MYDRLRLDSAGLTQTAIPFATGIRVEVAEDDGVLGSSTANAFLIPAPESDITSEGCTQWTGIIDLARSFQNVFLTSRTHGNA